MSDDDPFHAIVGPLEHKEFAADFVQENPAIAIPSLAIGTPLYTAAKALGVHSARSPASIDEVFAGYEGLISGTRSLLNKGR